MSRPRRGDVFTHNTVIEPRWRPDRTQTWSQAPKARMRVTDIRDGFVHYTYLTPDKDHARLSWSMPQAVFLEKFGDSLQPVLSVVNGGAA